MNGSFAVSASQSCTYTEARARYVLGKVHDHLIGLAMRNLLSTDKARDWIDTLLYLLDEQAIDCFEIQCRLPSGRSCGWRHNVDDTGSLVEDSPSGGVDTFALPPGTVVGLTVNLRNDCRNLDTVLRELERRGWGSGRLLDGPVVRERAYSRSGYGLIRSRVGQWDEE